MAKRKKSRLKSRKRKNPTRRCSVCRSAKHDRRKCRSKKRKSKKTRRRRRKNPSDFFSGKNMRAEWQKLMDQGLSPTYAVLRMQEIFGMKWSGIRRKLGKKFGTLPFSRRKNPGVRHNPCVTCGCTCKDTVIDTTRHPTSAADIANRARWQKQLDKLRREIEKKRENPGFSWKKGTAVPHEQQFDDLYQRPISRRSASPWRRNPCGSRHKPTRNPDCWMCDDTGYKGNDLCHCPAGNARSGANRYLRNPNLIGRHGKSTHQYCRDDRRFV